MKDHPHLLLADDNLDEVFFIARAIKRACPASELEVVADGLQAIERLSRALKQPQEALPDAMILDLKMPRKGGFDVLRWVKEHHAKCPVIIHTSSDEPTDTVESMKLGASSYIVKEVGYQPLVRKLIEVLQVKS